MADSPKFHEEVHELSAKDYIREHFPNAGITDVVLGKPINHLKVTLPKRQRDEFYAKMIAGGYELVCYNLVRMSQSNKTGENDLVVKWFTLADGIHAGRT